MGGGREEKWERKDKGYEKGGWRRRGERRNRERKEKGPLCLFVCVTLGS